MGQMSGHGTTNFDCRFKAAGASCFVEGGHELFLINSLGAALFSLSLWAAQAHKMADYDPHLG